jgi:hypothetical protein
MLSDVPRKKEMTASEMGKRGARMKMKKTTFEQRSEWAKIAINARWARYREQQDAANQQRNFR